VARHPYLSLRFVGGGIVAVLGEDADAVLARRADTVRQVAMADAVILTSATARDAVAALNPYATICEAATVRPAQLIGHGPFDADGDLDAWLGPQRSGHAPMPAGEAGRIHSFGVTRGNQIPIAALDRFLDYLAALQGQNLIRVRGAVATGPDEIVVVEGFGGFFYPPFILDRAPQRPVGARFVVIARDLDRATFEAYLDAFLNEAAALEQAVHVAVSLGDDPGRKAVRCEKKPLRPSFFEAFREQSPHRPDESPVVVKSADEGQLAVP